MLILGHTQASYVVMDALQQKLFPHFLTHLKSFF